MPPMEKSLFETGHTIGRDDLKKLEVENSGEAVAEGLRRFNWDGQAAGCLVLLLSPDNSTVSSGEFAARGRLSKDDHKWEASKIWGTAEAGLLLTLQLPDAGAFTFSEGGLCSDYLDMENVEHCVTTTGRGGQLVLQANYKDKGVGAFCLRLTCHIQRASARNGVSLGFSVLLFPGTSEEVCNISEWARSPSWPGLKVAEGEMPLLPNPSSPWGCPTLPFLQTGSPWIGNPTLPPMEELRGRIGAIMATSEPADTCKTRKTLMGRWERYTNNPDEFVPKRSPLTWPKPKSTRTQGRRVKITIYPPVQPLTTQTEVNLETAGIPADPQVILCEIKQMQTTAEFSAG